MAVPKYDELYVPFLKVIADGSEYSVREIRDRIARYVGLTDEDLNEMQPSGKQATFVNRVGWARTYLGKAELIETPRKRGYIRITGEGKRLLESGCKIDNETLAEKYPWFAAFLKNK